MKTVLSIQSQVAGSRVGNSVACFALERLGVDVIALPTTLYGRRPDRGPPGGGPTPAGLLRAMLDALELDGRLRTVDAILSGYIAAPEHGDVVLDAVRRVRSANPQAFYVCDPVMGDARQGATRAEAGASIAGEGFYVSPDVAETIVKRLAPASDIIIPNAWELETLTGLPARDVRSAIAAARSFGKTALITSTPSPVGIGVTYSANGGAWFVETPRVPDPPKGAGDLFAALFLARRLNGQSVAVALEAAMGSTYDVIVRSTARGDGELALIEAQDLLVDPETWPTAQPMGG
jgi:pyridoxine kinase